MEKKDAFCFLDFPVEIQQQIFWNCLEGWKATVEIHRKEGRTIARVFSSVIYDALMLSLTCKSFHQAIQRIQHDPRLFNGELDFIEANGQVAYLIGPGPWESWSDAEKLVPLYRTQIFIKNKPYHRTNYREERLQYHADARRWLMQNTTSIGIWADEIRRGDPWQMFPRLQHVTVYWPNVRFRPTDLDRSLSTCQYPNEDFVDLVKNCYNTDTGAWHAEGIKLAIDMLTSRGLKVTLHFETFHSHGIDADGRDAYVPASINGIEWGTQNSYPLEFQVQIHGKDWKVDQVTCKYKAQMGAQPVQVE